MKIRSVCVAALMSGVVGLACGGSVDDASIRDQGTSTSGAGGASGSAGSSAGAGTSSGGTSAGGTSAGGSSTGGSGGSVQNTCAATCAGCCSPDGQCRPGNTIGACGKSGASCLACDQLGFACQGGVCAGVKPPCDPTTCASGCCDAAGNCKTGDTSDACGQAGGACVDCAAQGKGCAAGACQGAPAPCGPATCTGCCDATGKCQPGVVANQCGAGGKACETCSGAQPTCTQPGSYCAAFPACGPQTCPDGCCDAAGQCVTGKENKSCGQKGQSCKDCAAASEECAPQGFCFAGKHCGPDNCAGCCTLTGECQAGGANDACGQYGTICANCTGGAECKNFACDAGEKCPAAYSGCNPQSITPPATPSKTCSSFELDAMEKACGMGMGSDKPCQDYFLALQQSNAACYTCTSQFFGDDAYSRCLAGFLTSYCNHQVTCAVDCSNVTCGDPSCPDTCGDTSFGKGGACAPHVYGYFCIQAALGGPGKICDFEAAGGDGGKWIRSVAGYYCGK